MSGAFGLLWSDAVHGMSMPRTTVQFISDMSKASKFGGVFLVTPNNDALNPVTGQDCPAEEELAEWHRNHRWIGLPILHEHETNNQIGRVLKTFTKKNGNQTVHRVIFEVDNTELAAKMKRGEVPFLSMAHFHGTGGGKPTVRFPTHIATTATPARAGTSVEWLASATGGTNSYVQSASVPDEKITPIEEPPEVMSVPVSGQQTAERTADDHHGQTAKGAST